ncbi:GNAT family N-acetyltransferase [Desulfosporosinus sp. PR]|uniref:GNAT family N-acetyltransferase n=1 Tax=Candidatus Desulfosporosinus nitrosoreducens TaxID=3401928 RepID=UPI0027F6AB41|nr:GNAT family N-acetyltransferase [Desulfosporosinus sp. PR]MDQ7094622.1 GNAT family N-acetyltransferase [Desulfosporosinus sp. PR]
MVNLKLENGYEIGTLTLDELKAVAELNEKCSDYYLLHEGEQPSEKNTLEIFNALPPGKNYEDKFVLGIFNDTDELIGIIDLVKNFPGEGEWMLGLFCIAPQQRDKGLGKLVHQTLVQWAVKLGAKSFRLGVLEENPKGMKFWSGLGYRKIKESLKVDAQQKTHVIKVMTIQIGC